MKKSELELNKKSLRQYELLIIVVIREGDPSLTLGISYSFVSG